jgi:hypothetical protein
MAKALLTLPSGHHVELDGSSDEIAELLRLYSGAYSPVPGPSIEQARIGKQRGGSVASFKRLHSSKSGPRAFIMELREAGYFVEKRTLNDIQRALEEQAHFYPQNTLSTPLIRLVRERLLRRVKEDRVWMYMNA